MDETGGSSENRKSVPMFVRCANMRLSDVAERTNLAMLWFRPTLETRRARVIVVIVVTH